MIFNSIGSPIKTTVEIANNTELLFLDVLISRQIINNSQSITTTVYRKPTSIGQQTNFISICPLSHEIAVIKSLTFMAIMYCSSRNDFEKEKNKICAYLVDNSYTSLVKKIFKNTLKFVNSTSILFQRIKRIFFICIPYYNISDKFLAYFIVSFSVGVFKTN